jgi:hypothetical protein
MSHFEQQPRRAVGYGSEMNQQAVSAGNRVNVREVVLPRTSSAMLSLIISQNLGSIDSPWGSNREGGQHASEFGREPRDTTGRAHPIF